MYVVLGGVDVEQEGFLGKSIVLIALSIPRSIACARKTSAQQGLRRAYIIVIIARSRPFGT